jgi:hypothetical protein
VAAGATVLALVLGATLIAIAAGVPEGATYIGGDKCKLCHFNDYRSWQHSKHANNFEVLQGDEKQNPDCLKCHTTGYGEPGGFVSLEETPKLINVQCESCHGPGSAHAEAAKNVPDDGQWDTKINKVPQNTCVKCHNPHVNQKERVMKLRQGN